MTTATATRTPITLRQAESMLTFVDGCEDREQWIAGMALKAEFGPEAFDAWDRWSSNAANYSAKACKASWRGFKSSSAGGVAAPSVPGIKSLGAELGFQGHANGNPLLAVFAPVHKGQHAFGLA